MGNWSRISLRLRVRRRRWSVGAAREPPLLDLQSLFRRKRDCRLLITTSGCEPGVELIAGVGDPPGEGAGLRRGRCRVDEHAIDRRRCCRRAGITESNRSFAPDLNRATGIRVEPEGHAGARCIGRAGTDVRDGDAVAQDGGLIRATDRAGLVVVVRNRAGDVRADRRRCEKWWDGVSWAEERSPRRCLSIAGRLRSCESVDISRKSPADSP